MACATEDLVDNIYEIYYIFFLRQNQQPSGIIQIYYGIIVNVYICDNDEKDPEPIQFYLADESNNPRAIVFINTVDKGKYV